MNGFFATMIIIVIVAEFRFLAKEIEKMREEILAEIRKVKQP